MHEEREPDLGRLVAYCGHLGRQRVDQCLRRSGYDVTPPQSRMLLYLCSQGDHPVNQRDLERELRLKSSTINGIVSRLEDKGYLLRRTSPDDARCRLVSLTEAGRQAVDTFRTALEETNRHFTGDMTEQEQAVLRELLSRIITNLENEVSNV